MDRLQRSPEGISRRTMLKRSAFAGGAAVWAVPTIQTLLQQPAGAASAVAPGSVTTQVSVGGQLLTCTWSYDASTNTYTPTGCV